MTEIIATCIGLFISVGNWSELPSVLTKLATPVVVKDTWDASCKEKEILRIQVNGENVLIIKPTEEVSDRP